MFVIRISMAVNWAVCGILVDSFLVRVRSAPVEQLTVVSPDFWRRCERRVPFSVNKPHEERGLVVWIEEGWGALPWESLANRLTPSVRHQLSSISDEPPSVGRRLQSIVRQTAVRQATSTGGSLSAPKKNWG